MDAHSFINRIKGLYNIDHHRLPELTDEQWVEFRDDPPRYLIRTDKVQADAIIREVEKRQENQQWLEEAYGFHTTELGSYSQG